MRAARWCRWKGRPATARVVGDPEDDPAAAARGMDASARRDGGCHRRCLRAESVRRLGARCTAWCWARIGEPGVELG